VYRVKLVLEFLVFFLKVRDFGLQLGFRWWFSA